VSLITLIREEGSLQPARVATISALAGLSSAGVLAVINAAADRVAHHQPSTDYFFAFLAIVVVYAISKQFILLTSIKETEQIVHRIRLRIVSKVMRSDLVALDKIGRTNISASASKETQIISTATVMLITAAESLAMLVFAVLYLAWLSMAAFFIGVGFTLVAVFVHFRRMRRVNQELRAALDQENACLDTLTDFLYGFKELKVHSPRAADLFNYFSHLSRRATNSKIAAQVRMGEHFTLTQIMFYMLIGTMVFVVPVFSSSFAGAVVKTSTSVLFMFGSISALVSTLPILAQANAAADNIREIEKKLDQVSRPASQAVAPIREFKEIAFRNVIFEHHDALDNPTFSVGPMNLTLRSGEMIFVTGGNGSGKSTLIKLLIGLYRPTSGFIQIDDRIIDEQSIDDYRNMFAVVFSDFHLFKRLFGLTDASPATIDALLHLLEIEDKTKVQDGEFTTLDLSGGQRKRLALLVAMLEDRPVIVLDEWAADQDPVFRRKFYEVILPELKRQGKTIIAITHDDRYFEGADRQLKLEDGQIAADIGEGSHA
jgi:putative pyoverdin transport system ATP-binding/permease protein